MHVGLRQAVIGTAALAVSIAAAGCGQSGGGGKSAARPPVVPASSAAATATPTPSPQGFSAQVSAIAAASALPYSWHQGCPVPVSGLRAIDMTYWGMDGAPHQGRLIVNKSVTTDVVKVFKTLYDQRFPIRRMEPVDVYKGSDFDSVEADNTSAFNCRAVSGSSSWSQHAYGLAIDINPCENPYVDVDGSIAHPACVKFGDRSRTDPGMIHKGDVVWRAFDSIGWGWGGSWSGATDSQHFSSTGH